MNKLILCFLVLASLPLYAQDEAEEKKDPSLNLPVTTKEEFVPTVEHPEQPVSEEIVEPGEVTSGVRTDEEFVAPAVPGAVKPVSAEKRPSPVFNMEAEVDDKKRFNPRESHWLFQFAFENTRYEVIPEKRFEFEGKKDFRNDQQELWGGRLGFGGEIYLGAGFVTRSMVEGYYMGTLFSRVLNGGAEEEDIKFAFTKRTGQILGVDASQSLGWMFDFKTKNPFIEEWAYLTVEPFVEAGIGRAQAYNRINYSYKLDTTDEAYRLRVRDELVNARIGGGINLTSSAGFFLVLKATVNRMDITKRKIDGYIQENGQIRDPIKLSNNDAKIDPIVIYTIGGGYKF